jgi:hypothetical protein
LTKVDYQLVRDYQRKTGDGKKLLEILKDVEKKEDRTTTKLWPEPTWSGIANGGKGCSDKRKEVVIGTAAREPSPPEVRVESRFTKYVNSALLSSSRRRLGMKKIGSGFQFVNRFRLHRWGRCNLGRSRTLRGL